jgi:hypothetical protein
VLAAKRGVACNNRRTPNSRQHRSTLILTALSLFASLGSLVLQSPVQSRVISYRLALLAKLEVAAGPPLLLRLD